MNAILKYPGAKWRIADWIISHFPAHHSYLEPFAGSGAVLFKKPRSNIETVNDLDGNIVNLFECIKGDPERLVRMIYLTPYARQVYEETYTETPTEPYQRAVSFIVSCNMGHGYRTNGHRVGWKNDIQGRERAYAAKNWTELPGGIIAAAERLRGVQIECCSAVEVIERFNYNNVLIYADPPYVLGTRHGKQYKCEMDDRDHKDLLDTLLAHKGPVIVSGYESELYSDALQGWHIYSAMSMTQSLAKKQEILWTNFEPTRQLDIKLT